MTTSQINHADLTLKYNNLVKKVKRNTDLLKFILSIDDLEIIRSTIESIIDNINDEN